MRAGSDIGYCDSDYPRTNFEWCELDIQANIEALGFELEDVHLSDCVMDLYLIDKDTNVAYDYIDLPYHIYETFTRRDFLKEYDNRFSPCCGADIYEDYGRCKHCKEAVL
jgi:hypothetical protein